MAAVSEVDHPDRLREMAETYEERAAALFEERISLLREASDCRHAAEMIETREQRHVTVRRLPTVPNRRGREIPARDLAAVADVIRSLEPTTIPAVAEHLNISVMMARARVRRLEDLGTVYRTGLKSSTRWHIASDDEQQTSSTLTSLREQVRDIGCELGTFTAQEIVDAGPSHASTIKWLAYWCSRGLFEREKIGREYVYGVVQHESEPVNRPKVETPERAVVRQMPRQRETTSGRRHRSGSTVVNQLIREVSRQGVEVRKTKHKVEFVKDGQVIASASGTPGASALGGTRKQLREAGVKA